MSVLIITDIIMPTHGIEDIGKYEIDGFEIVIAEYGIPGIIITSADS